MYDINDFLNYASNGNVSAPATTRKVAHKVTSRPVQLVDMDTHLHTFALNRMTLPSGPIMIHAYQPEPETIQASTTMPVQPVKPALELVDYSERSFAIFGDTKPMQAKLEALGGKFNRWLKREGVATPGYIFSIGRIESVQKALNI